MPEPREYRILLALQTALRGIAIGSDYFHTVAAVAVKLDPDQGVEALVGDEKLRPFIVLEPNPETWDWPNSEKPNGIYLILPVTIYFVNQADQTDDTSLMKTYFRGCADVEQAIATETMMGDLAQMPKIVKRSFSAVGGEVWSIVQADVHISRQYGQPNG